MGNNFTLQPASGGDEGGSRTLSFVCARLGALESLATAPELSNPAGTYGVLRLDTMAVVVADSVPFTAIGDYLYQATFVTPADGLIYRYYIEAVIDGLVYHLPRTTAYGNSAMLAVGRYTNSHQIEQAFGVDNVHKWLSIDEHDDAVDYCLRAAAFIVDAESELDDRLRGGPCDVPFEDAVPELISKLACNLAAVRAYEARGVVDMNPETGQVQHRLQFQQRWTEKQVAQIKAGQLRLTADNVTRHPVLLP